MITLLKKIIEDRFIIDPDRVLIKSLIDDYLSSSKKGREQIRNDVFESKSNLKLLSLSERLSELAFQEKSTGLIEDALYLHSIEDFRWDPRENIIYLSVIWFVLNKLKMNAQSLFGKVKLVSSARACQYFSEFENRSDALKSLKAMGLKAHLSGRKITFEIIKPAWGK